MSDAMKLPVGVDELFLKSIRYRYGTAPRNIIELKGKKKTPSLEKGVTYWVPETYRIVRSGERKLIQYKSDSYKNQEKWVDDRKMKKAYARYHFECVGVETKKLNKLGKKDVILNGTFPERIIIKGEDPSTMPGKFKTKSYEIWRFATKWDEDAPEGSKWDDNPEIFVYNVVVHRVKPEYDNYYDHHWTENEINKDI